MLEGIHSCLHHLPMKLRTKVHSARGKEKEWVQILDLLLSEDVVLSKLFL